MAETGKRARVVCISNHKGGVGKTCSVCNIGAGLSRLGKKVLLIDLDPQENLTISLGVKEVEQNMYSVMAGNCSIKEATIHITDKLHIVPSTIDLSATEIELSSESGREMILKEALEDVINDYDFILIDCAPSLGLLTLNALTAASGVLIPLQAQFLALKGLSKLTEVIKKVQKRLNKNLEVGGVIITQYSARKIMCQDVANFIEENFSNEVFKTRIRENVTLAEAPMRGQDVFRYSPKSNGAADYENLCKEILERCEVSP